MTKLAAGSTSGDLAVWDGTNWVSSPGTSAVQHHTLGGLTHDDHAQYFLLAGETTDVKLHSGADLIVYSDAGMTEKARIDGATGNVTTSGTVDGVDVSAHETDTSCHGAADIADVSDIAVDANLSAAAQTVVTAGPCDVDANLSAAAQAVVTAGACDVDANLSAAAQAVVTAGACDVDANLSANAQDAVSKRHSQNTDTLLAVDGAPADHGYAGVTVTGTAGEAVALADVCYLKSDGKFWLCDADAEATSAGLVVLAAAAIAQNDAGTFLLIGRFRDDTWNWATKGANLYIHTATGNPTDTAPSGSGDIIRTIGQVIDADNIMFNPDQYYDEVA